MCSITPKPKQLDGKAESASKPFSSSIPGQMLDNEEELSIPLLLISLFGATLAFLLSLSWAAFLSDSVEAVHKATNQKIPLPVARLIAALIVSATAVGLLVCLFQWERRASRNMPETTSSVEQSQNNT